MDWSVLQEVAIGFMNLGWREIVMIIIGLVLIYLAVAKEYEPTLLIPIGVGVILVNIPVIGQEITAPDGFLGGLYQFGIKNELFPLLIFVGIGAMTDFGPMLENPKLVLLGAAAQFGIFGTLLLALVVGFPLKEAASIGIIGSADGPTSIYVASEMSSKYLGAIVVAAYSYMSMVPIIQPPIMRLLTTKGERQIRMPYTSRAVSKRTRILFPIFTFLVASFIAPMAAPLIGMLMFGNLMRECGVLDRLAGGAQNELTNIVTILLGITVGSTMTGQRFLGEATIVPPVPDAVLIFAMGLFAFALDTAAGVLFGKVMCYLSGRKVNPLVGASGISAFPMSARVVQRVGQEEDFSNHLLFHAMASNTAGQIGSVLAGGALLALLAH